jgi:hypothetical protein
MPYEIQAQPTRINVTLRGEVTSRDLLRYAKEVSDLEAASPASRNLITELTGISAWNLSSAEMHEFTTVRSTTVLKNRVKSALVATRNLDYGMARMFELMMKHPNIEVRVFRDIPSAVEWLG